MDLQHNPAINPHIYNNDYETNENFEDNFEDPYKLTHPSIITKYPSTYVFKKKILKALLQLGLP
jgi:hypothetical protein